MRRSLPLVAVCLAIAASGTDCLNPLDKTPANRVAALRGFSSGDDLRAYLSQQARVQRTNRSGGFFPVFGFLPAPMAGQEDTSNLDGDGAGGDDYSSTNIQEFGVDESDIVKNDGQTIYVMDGDTVHIVQALPPGGMIELATIKLEEAGDSMYLRSGQLVILSQRYNWFYPGPFPLPLIDVVTGGAEDGGAGDGDLARDMIGGIWNDGGEVTVTVVDVSDPSRPRTEATLRFEGNLATSRMIDNRLYLVLNSTPWIPEMPVPILLDFIPLDQWLPDYEIEDADGTTRSGDIVDYADVFRPEVPNGYGITTVVTIDVDNPTAAFESTAVVADAGVTYASREALYLTDTDYDWNQFLPREDTDIHKLSFTAGGTQYVASGRVPGRPLNQYSLGEHEGYLRIATTVSDFSPTRSTANAVYVLGVDGADLEVVGSIEGLAPGESIYSARFIGDRGFLVTFVRVDPLYTLDLSDPTDPRVVGELKVPGYSDHIQMLDDDHLLTIGKDAVADASFGAWIQGVQLSIFDVSDMSNPVQLWNKVIGSRGTHSEANHNPKAFNFYASRGVVAFPIDVYGEGGPQPWSYGDRTFTGLQVYSVSAQAGIDYMGGISSMDDQQNGCYWSYWGFTRGVFIGDTVYAITQNGVKAANLSDMETLVGEVAFENPRFAPNECYFLAEPDILLPGGGGVR